MFCQETFKYAYMFYIRKKNALFVICFLIHLLNKLKDTTQQNVGE